MAKLFSSIRQWPRKFRNFVYYQLLHADDPPHQLALGVAVGVFIAFTPTVGFQMVLVIIFAWMLRANRAAGLPIVWISNPFTMIPIFYGTYWVGRIILWQPYKGDEWWNRLYSPPPGWWPTVKFYWTEFADIAAPLWLGSIVVAFAFAIPSYLATYYGIRAYRLKRFGTLTPPPSARKQRKKQRTKPVKENVKPSTVSEVDLPPETSHGDLPDHDEAGDGSASSSG